MPRRRPDRATEVTRRVSERVRMEREAAGSSLAEVAAAMGEMGCPIQPTGLWRVEKFERDVRVDEAVALARVFDITLDSLLFGSFDSVDAAERRCARIMDEARHG